MRTGTGLSGAVATVGDKFSEFGTIAISSVALLGKIPLGERDL